ncbi:hypothetical protein [Paractinoplanes durhamensis]|uniref:hypothetical protein n=1 Tax=Paractinoplanes durhamensis TaxID=113563 RepID=UPI00363641CC
MIWPSTSFAIGSFGLWSPPRMCTSLGSRLRVPPLSTGAVWMVSGTPIAVVLMPSRPFAAV